MIKVVGSCRRKHNDNNSKEGDIGADNTSGLAGSDFLIGIGDKIGRRTEKASHPQSLWEWHTRSRTRSLVE